MWIAVAGACVCGVVCTFGVLLLFGVPAFFSLSLGDRVLFGVFILVIEYILGKIVNSIIYVGLIVIIIFTVAILAQAVFHIKLERSLL